MHCSILLLLLLMVVLSQRRRHYVAVHHGRHHLTVVTHHHQLADCTAVAHLLMTSQLAGERIVFIIIITVLYQRHGCIVAV